MKKLFVSVPMKGRETEDIKRSIEKMKKIAEIYVGEELELIDSYIEDNPPTDTHEAIWYLGEAIKKLAEADVFICIADAFNWSGCHVEDEVARRYKIKRYYVPSEAVIENYRELIKKAEKIFPLP